MFTNILVPLDTSPLAEQALGQAELIARAAGAAIDLVLVHETVPVDGFGGAPWNARVWKEESEYLSAIAAEVRAGSSVPVSCAVIEGEAVDMICRRAEEVDADLIVMSSHGRTGLSRAWLGSVADGLVQRSTRPVLMLRPTEGGKRTDARHPMKKILVPIDGSTSSREVLSSAIAMATAANARLALVRVVQPPPMIAADAGRPFTFIPEMAAESTTASMADDAGEFMIGLAHRLRDETGLVVETTIVVDEHVASAILDVARSHAADAIAMSTHGHGLSRFVLGSVADKVLRGSTLPLLLYRPTAARVGSHETESVVATRTGALAMV